MKPLVDINNLPSDADLDDLKNIIGDLKQRFDQYKVSLSLEERQKYRKMGPRRLAYVNTAVDKALEHEGIMPRNFDPQTFATVVNTYAKLKRVLGPLNSIVEAMDDTLLAIGVDAMSYTRVTHDSIRTANTVNPSLDESLKELDEFNKRSKQDDTTAPTNGDSGDGGDGGNGM